MTSRPSRRQVVGALSATMAGGLALPARASAQDAQFDFDCIVVGAGISGIAAAHELKKRGKTYVILEARNRVGGRIYTDHSLGQPYDAGAYYIHWAERNPLLQIATDAGVKPAYYENFETGDNRRYDRGHPPANPKSGEAWERVREKYDGKSVPDTSFVDFATYLEPMSRDRALVAARLGLGEEGERISARDYARLWAGHDYLVPGGLGTAVTWCARGLNVRLSTPVSTIEWSGKGVRVTGPKGTVTARKVIVTASVGVLKTGAIKFLPKLPAINLAGLEGLGMGASTRAALRFNGERFGLNANSSLRLRLSERASFSFGCFTFDRDIVTCYFGGDHARGVIGLGEKAALKYILSQFASLVGSKVRKAFVDGRLNGWWADSLARGGYSHTKTGHAEARFKLATPVGDRLLFAGEAVGCAYKGGDAGCAITAGGAFLSGVRAAKWAAG